MSPWYRPFTVALCCIPGPISPSSFATHKIFHLLAFAISSSIALLIRFHPPSPTCCRFHRFSFHPDDVASSIQISSRIFIASFVFFFSAFIESSIRKSFYFGKLSTRMFIWIIIVGFCLVVPFDSMFDLLIYVAIAGSVLYVVAQSVLVISFGHQWDQHWRGLGRPTRVLNVICALLFMMASTFLVHRITARLSPDRHPHAITLIAISVVTSLVSTIISLSRLAPRRSILTPSLLSTYNLFVVYQAISMSSNDGQVRIASRAIGFTICGIVIIWRTFSSSNTSIFGSSLSQTVIVSDLESALAKSNSPSLNHHPVALRQRWAPAEFFLLMCLASLYLMAHASGNDARSSLSSWAYLIASWATSLIYLWTLIAPKLLKKRDFGVDI